MKSLRITDSYYNNSSISYHIDIFNRAKDIPHRIKYTARPHRRSCPEHIFMARKGYKIEERRFYGAGGLCVDDFVPHLGCAIVLRAFVSAYKV